MPAFLRGLDELEDYRECGLVGEAALRTDRAVPHRGERAFERREPRRPRSSFPPSRCPGGLAQLLAGFKENEAELPALARDAVGSLIEQCNGADRQIEAIVCGTTL
jgi:hypothetical protein